MAGAYGECVPGDSVTLVGEYLEKNGKGTFLYSII